MNDPILTTPRLFLRYLDFGDTRFIVELLNDPDYIRNIGDRNVRTGDHARHYLASGPMESYTTHGFGLFCVVREEDNIPIGTCGLLKRGFLDFPDLGYAFLPGFRSRGYAREAAAGVMGLARDKYGITRIGAIVNPDNLLSIRLLERIGFYYKTRVIVPETKKAVKLFVSDL